MNDRIIYIVPFALDRQFTPIQGFSRGLLGTSFLLRRIVYLPASVTDLTISKDALRERKVVGDGAYSVRFIPDATLSRFSLSHPFVVIFSDERTLAPVRAWLAERGLPSALHVSTTKSSGSLALERLSRQSVRSWLRRTLRQLTADPTDGADAQRLLGALLPNLRRRPLSFPQRWHNTVVPNELTLISAGMRFHRTQRLAASPNDDECVSAIASTAEKIRSLRTRRLEHIPTCRPSLILTTTGASAAAMKSLSQPKPELRAASVHFRAGMKVLREQQGYFHVVDESTAQTLEEQPDAVRALLLRSQEHMVQTNALTLRAASELSAVIRLPARAAACRDKVIRLADCYRGRAPRQTTKLNKAHAALVDALRQGVPDQLYELIRTSAGAIRVVSDLPLEWLPAGHGLPLSLDRECSRIPATPGDLLFLQLLPRDPLFIPVTTLREPLIIRSFSEGDPLAGMLDVAIPGYLGADTRSGLKVVDCNNKEQLYDALNSYDGPWVIFNGHGQSTAQGSQLCVGADRVTGMDIMANARVPPIFFLVACDTQPMDGTHSSVANAILAAGARSVLASLLPIDGRYSSIFVGRLLHAIKALLPTLLSRNLGVVRWSTLVTMVARGQLVYEYGLFSQDRRPETRDADVDRLQRCVAAISAERPDWFQLTLEELSSISGKKLRRYGDLATIGPPLPDVISNLQMGDPHNVFVVDPSKGVPREQAPQHD